MRQYAFKITWYSDYDEHNHNDCGVLIAEDFQDAMKRVYDRFPELIHVTLHESLDEDEFIFLTPAMYMDYVGNDYAFVNWDDILRNEEEEAKLVEGYEQLKLDLD